MIGGRELYPVNKCVGFLEIEAADAVKFFADWRKSINPLSLASIKPIDLPFEKALTQLEPLSEQKNKYLFVPTKSDWVAVFDNYFRGPDLAGDLLYCCRQMSCRGIRALMSPEDGNSSYACSFETFGPAQTNEPLNYIRTVTLANDGGWTFSTSGPPYEFEQVDKYESRLKKDRFNFEMLKDYLVNFGIDLFNIEFYRSHDSQLLELKTPSRIFLRGYSLSDVQRLDLIEN